MSSKIRKVANICTKCGREYFTWTRPAPAPRPCYACDLISKGLGGVLKEQGVLIP